MDRVGDSRGERTLGIWSLAGEVGKGYKVPREVKRGRSQRGGEREGQRNPAIGHLSFPYGLGTPG